jgi:hypothetical protein
MNLQRQTISSEPRLAMLTASELPSSLETELCSVWRRISGEEKRDSQFQITIARTGSRSGLNGPERSTNVIAYTPFIAVLTDRVLDEHQPRLRILWTIDHLGSCMAAQGTNDACAPRTSAPRPLCDEDHAVVGQDPFTNSRILWMSDLCWLPPRLNEEPPRPDRGYLALPLVRKFAAMGSNRVLQFSSATASIRPHQRANGGTFVGSNSREGASSKGYLAICRLPEVDITRPHRMFPKYRNDGRDWKRSPSPIERSSWPKRFVPLPRN